MRGPNTARAGVLAAAMLVLIAVAAVKPASSFAAACPNEAIRKEQQSTFLPECRAYELVSPPEADVEYLLPRVQAPVTPETVGSESGERVSYFSYAPNAGDVSSGFDFLATRGEEGWSTVSAVPPQSVGSEEPGCYPGVYFSPSLTSNLLIDGGLLYAREGLRDICQTNEPGLAADEPEGGAPRIFRHDWGTGSYETVNPTPAGAAAEAAVLEDATPDQSHVLFAETGELVAGAPKGLDLYESAGGKVRLVTYLPSGQPVAGQLVDGHSPAIEEGHMVAPESGSMSAATMTHAESEDGERVFFTAEAEGRRNLYMRVNASRAPIASGACSAAEPEGACTVQLDVKQGGSEEGGGTFLYASVNGSRVFFMDEARLTGDATAKPSEPDLYEYDVEAAEGHRLKDLTVSAGKPADVQGFTGASEDGSYLYFVADGVLAAGAVEGRPNLYLDHAGTLSLVATLNGEYDREDWAGSGNEVDSAYEVGHLRATTSASGRFLAFTSVETEKLAKYNNQPAKQEECPNAKYQDTGPCREIFRYSAGEGTLVCASCDPSGKRPTGPAELEPLGDTPFGGFTAIYRVRELLENGDLFFSSPDRLVEADKNESYDLYEYAEREPRLISSGTGEGAVAFAEASANGENVFFVTTQSLLAADTTGAPSMYDARVNGGFQAQSAQPPPPEECTGAEGCRRPPPEPPVKAFGASSAFAGAGDLTPLEGQLEEPAGGQANKQGKPGLTRAQRLRRALKRCRRRRGRRARRRCRARARRRFDRHHSNGHGHGSKRRYRHTRRHHAHGKGRAGR